MRLSKSSKHVLTNAGQKSQSTRTISRPHQSTSSMVKKHQAKKLLEREIRVQEALRRAKEAYENTLKKKQYIKYVKFNNTIMKVSINENRELAIRIPLKSGGEPKYINLINKLGFKLDAVGSFAKIMILAITARLERIQKDFLANLMNICYVNEAGDFVDYEHGSYNQQLINVLESAKAHLKNGEYKAFLSNSVERRQVLLALAEYREPISDGDIKFHELLGVLHSGIGEACHIPGTNQDPNE